MTVAMFRADVGSINITILVPLYFFERGVKGIMFVTSATWPMQTVDSYFYLAHVWDSQHHLITGETCRGAGFRVEFVVHAGSLASILAFRQLVMQYTKATVRTYPLELMSATFIPCCRPRFREQVHVTTKEERI